MVSTLVSPDSKLGSGANFNPDPLPKISGRVSIKWNKLSPAGSLFFASFGFLKNPLGDHLAPLEAELFAFCLNH